ncbi:MAG: hypothetical protein VB051_01350 [Candidatus Pelethousia sp.]|nr:hypothetical protein [Candidatus Pelethousia sp.]
MAGKKELQAMLAQRENAVAQREAEIAVLTKRVEELMGREAQLQAEVTDYRSRGEAIINALTEAQRAAARIREEADAYKTQVVGNAYSERDAAQREAEETIQAARQEAGQIRAQAESQAAQLRAEAQEQAAQTRQEAEQKAAQRIAQADAYVAEAEQKAAGLKERLRQAAEEARQQAAAFGSFVLDIGNSSAGTAKVEAVALPEDYNSPQALMQNIYALQGRSLPGEESEEAPLCEPEPKPEPEPEPNSQAGPQPEPQIDAAPVVRMESELDADALLVELVSALDGPAPAKAPAEERVYSVSDILSAAPVESAAAPAMSVPGGLDDIIDDILRGI